MVRNVLLSRSALVLSVSIIGTTPMIGSRLQYLPYALRHAIACSVGGGAGQRLAGVAVQ